MSIVPGSQIPISCLHCKQALTVGSYHPLTDVIEHDGKLSTLSCVLTELFPHKEETYPNTSNKAFCQRCFDGVHSAWKASKSAITAVEDFISLSKEEGLVGFLGNDLNTYLNSHILTAVVKQKLPEEEVNWFSLVSYGAKKDMACYGSEKGVQFVQHHNNTLQTFQDFTSGLVSLDSSNGVESSQQDVKPKNVKPKPSPKGGKGKGKSVSVKKNETEPHDSISLKEDFHRSLKNIAPDDPNNWICAVCDKTFKRKKHALLHIRVAHKLSGEDVEKVVVDRSVQEQTLSKKRKRGDDSSESCEEPEEGEESCSEENPAKYQKQSDSVNKSKDWECLECHSLFLWKRNLLSHLRNDHSRDLTEVQKYVQHNRKPSGKKVPSYYFTCARHSWKTFEHEDECIQHIKRVHKLGYDKALKMVVKVNVSNSDLGEHESPKNQEEQQSDQPAIVADDCPTLSPVSQSEESTQSSMPQLDPEIATSGDTKPSKEEEIENLKAENILGPKRETPKLWACCLCGHKTTSRDVVKRHLSSNHNMSRKNSERLIKYLGEEDEEEIDEFEVFDDDDNDKTYSPISEKGKKRKIAAQVSQKPWKCSMCTCKYAHRKDLMRHRNTKHDVPEGVGIMWKPAGHVVKEEQESINEPPKVLDLNELSKEKEWACIKCGKKYFRRLDVHRHIRQKHQEVATSSEVASAIHKSSMDPDAWRKIEEPENDDESLDARGAMLPYACGMCGNKFKKRSQITRHLTDQHFLSDKDHEFYIKRNEEFKKRWKCLVCEKRYFYRFDVCRHVSQIHSIAWEKTQDSVQFLDDDSILSDDEIIIGNNGKIYMCARCRKGFNTKRSLISHIGEFHKCLLTVANIEEFVKDMRKVSHPILDYTGCSDEEVAGKVRATEFVNYIVNQTKSYRANSKESERSVILEKVKCVEISGCGRIGDEEWGKLCGTAGDLGSYGIYRSRKDDNKKKHVCMLCKKRYYRHKEAQRHLTQKHGVTYAESANYIIQDMQVESLDESNESRPQRKPKRRLVSKGRKYMLHCVKCLRTSAYFETLKKHTMKSHHLKEQETHHYICRTSNADVLKLAYEDKMNFICVLCGMTFKNRLDAYAHCPRSHSQYSEADKRNLVFEKTGEDMLYIVHTTRETGKSKVFSINLESLIQDAHVIKEEDHDNTKIEDETLDEPNNQGDADDRSNSPPVSETSTKDKRKSRTKVKTKESEIEDFMCIMLDHYSQLGSNPDLEKEYSLQYSFDDFYMVFTVPGKAEVTSKVWCEVCMKVFKDETEMSNHLGKCQSKAWTKWECLNCRKEFEDMNSLVNHISEEYGLISESDILTYVRSKELIEVPDNNAFLLIDGRNDEEVNLLYHSLKLNQTGANGRMVKASSSTASLAAKEYKPCFICGHRNSSRKDLFQHMKEVHKISGMNKLTNCLECMMQFKSQDELATHLVSIHNITIAHPTLYFRNCLVCNASFKSNIALSYHLKSHKIFTCPVCRHHFQVYLKLYKHMQREHSGGLSPRVKCNLCPTVLKPTNLEDHMVCHYDRAFGPWICVVCNKEFVIRKHLKEHLRGRHNVFVCYRCGQQFDCLHTFRRHESVHKLSAKSRRAFEEYKCDVCGGSFISASMLRIHKQNNCQQFICHVCGKKMCNKATLASHIRNHQLGKLTKTKKQRTCSTCNKTLSSHAMWKRHQVVHSKQKPNHCGICGAKFSFINALRYHLQKKHPEYKPYKCPVCDQSFLTTHIRNFHVKMMHKDYVDPNKPIKCQYCDCRFKQIVGLRNHMRKKHQDKLLLNHKYFECKNCPRIYRKRKSYLKHVRECSQSQVNTDLFNAIRVNVNTKITSRDSRSLLNPANQLQQNQPQYIITALPEGEGSVHDSTSGMETITYVTTDGDAVLGPDLAGDVELEAATEGSQVVNIGDSIITLPGGRQIRFQNDQSQYMEIPSDMLIETPDGGYFIVVSEANT